MMSYEKYERGFQHLHAGHQKITYEKKKNMANTYPTTLRLTQSNQGTHACHTRHTDESHSNINNKI